MSTHTRTLLPLYHIYVECKENFSWIDCEETISKKLTGNCNLFAMVNDEFENIQNALLSSHEDISHINAQVTELFFVAIPSSNFSFRDFIKFAKIDLNEIIGSVRVVNPSTKQHSICIKFQNIENAQKCFLRCHGKRYLNKNDICHVLFAVKFEIVQTEELLIRDNQMKEYKYLQLPLCPSCLERLDPTISNVWPHYCDEVENASFYNQIISSSSASSIHQSIESSPQRILSINNNINDENEGDHVETDNVIIGIDDEYSEFVYDNHYTATSAGVCRCISHWTAIQCPVCNKISEITRKQKEIEQQEETKDNNHHHSLLKNKNNKTHKKKKKKNKKKHNNKHRDKNEDETKYNKQEQEEEEEENNDNNNNKICCCKQTNDYELWICLICGHLGCGRFKQSHALQHYVKTWHPFCVNLQTLSVWDYTNDAWQHRLFQKRTLRNEMQRERERQKQQQSLDDDYHITPGGPHHNHQQQQLLRIDDNDNDNNHNHNNSNNNDNNNGLQTQPLDEYSRATVMAKLDNVREYYNKLLLDVIQQQCECYESQITEIKKENNIKCNEKKQIIHKLKEKLIECDKKREAIELWNKIQEMREKNLLKKKEFQQTVNKTRAHKKELEKLKAKYDKKEQRLRQQKNKQKQLIQQQIDKALTIMTQ